MATTNIEILPAPVNLSFIQGDYVALTLRVPSDIDGEYVNFAGYTFLSQIRTNAFSETVLATFTVTATGATPSTYGISVTLDAEDTADLPQTCVWDLKVIDSGDPRTYFAGDVTVYPDVSRTP